MMQIDEYYPDPEDILAALGDECVMVGSAALGDLATAKDIDLVVPKSALLRLTREYGPFLVRYSNTYFLYVPLEEGAQAIDIFCGLGNIEDETKHAARIPYEVAITRPLQIKVFHGREIRALR